MERDVLTKQIHDAGQNRHVLRIVYKDKQDRVQIRNVEPYEIKNDHLFAYCRKRKGIRQFHLDRIQKAKPTAYTYFDKWPVKLGEDFKKVASSINPWHYAIPTSVFGSYYNAQVE